jgi:predicted site-specific integrase-resolvase
MKRISTDMLTARTFAKEKGVSYTTIMSWLRDALIPGAAQEETPMGMVWQIPASSLEKVEKRRPGLKPAATKKAKKEGAAR